MCFEYEIHKWPSWLTGKHANFSRHLCNTVTWPWHNAPPYVFVSFSQQSKSCSKLFERKRQHYPPAHYTRLSQRCQQSVSKSAAGLGLISSLNISSSFLGLQESQGCSPDGYLSGQLSPTRDVISSWASCLTETQEHARMHAEREAEGEEKP